ncbi:MAG: arginine--tRNA ligase [Chitinophagales bacterium]
MTSIESIIQAATSKALKTLFDADFSANQVTINDTRKEFEGDVTVVIFPLLRFTKKKPEESGEMIGAFLKEHLEIVEHFNVVKGFLNIGLTKAYWQNVLQDIYDKDQFAFGQPSGQTIMVEYSSPNTNKPLHLGHLRNNILGFAVSGLLEANGHKVIKTNLINDRGIHICKSMIAWQKWGNGETPESTGMKGDHLVGKYYVEFDKQYKAQIQELVDNGTTEAEAKKQAPLMLETQEMLRQWEAGNEEVRALWQKMNQWVYDGFAITYKNIGVSFDQMYYESDTYLLGKEVVLEGLNKGIFFKKEDGSVWVDLTDRGLDEKILLRADGTSVYITQDIGTADKKYADHKMDRSLYVVGNEQDYHFKVLKEICLKLERPHAEGIQHFSYGMVDLPSGKMKSREGTVVDADDLMAEMIATVKQRTEELGKIEGFTDEEAEELFRTIALGALKFFLLRIEPRKGMLFNPEESIDFHGYTGTFTQFNYARIRSIVRKFESKTEIPNLIPKVDWEALEMDLIQTVSRFPRMLADAGEQLNPAAVVDYAYNLAKSYSKYYAEVPILGVQDENVKTFRVMLSSLVARTIQQAFAIMGINVPERM